MSKPPTKQWEYISDLEDENLYVVGFELWNIETLIRNINNNPRSESPVYQKIIIPHLRKLYKKLETLEEKINHELEIDGDKSIYELVYEEN